MVVADLSRGTLVTVRVSRHHPNVVIHAMERVRASAARRVRTSQKREGFLYGSQA